MANINLFSLLKAKSHRAIKVSLCIGIVFGAWNTFSPRFYESITYSSSLVTPSVLKSPKEVSDELISMFSQQMYGETLAASFIEELDLLTSQNSSRGAALKEFLSNKFSSSDDSKDIWRSNVKTGLEEFVKDTLLDNISKSKKLLGTSSFNFSIRFNQTQTWTIDTVFSTSNLNSVFSWVLSNALNKTFDKYESDKDKAKSGEFENRVASARSEFESDFKVYLGKKEEVLKKRAKLESEIGDVLGQMNKLGGGGSRSYLGSFSQEKASSLLELSLLLKGPSDETQVSPILDIFAQYGLSHRLAELSAKSHVDRKVLSELSGRVQQIELELAKIRYEQESAYKQIQTSQVVIDTRLYEYMNYISGEKVVLPRIKVASQVTEGTSQWGAFMLLLGRTFVLFIIGSLIGLLGYLIVETFKVFYKRTE